MSKPLVEKLAENDEFLSFLHVAKARNTMGIRCNTVQECANQPFETHMWHHEDAGISYNVWRMAAIEGLNVAIVHLPERGWAFPWVSDYKLLSEDYTHTQVQTKCIDAHVAYMGRKASIPDGEDRLFSKLPSVGMEKKSHGMRFGGKEEVGHPVPLYDALEQIYV